MGTKLYLFEKLDFFFHRYFLRVFLTFSRGLFFTRTISQFFQWLDFSTGKKWSKLSRSPKSATTFCRGRRLRPPVVLNFVAVAEVGDKNLSRSPTSAAGYFQIRRGRRSGRQNFVAVADFGLDRGGPGYAPIIHKKSFTTFENIPESTHLASHT